MNFRCAIASRRRSASLAGTVLLGALGLSAGLQSGYAQDASLQQTPRSPTGKAASPAVCGPVGFVRASYAVGASPTDVHVMDLNGDGRLDLVTANWASDNASVLLGNANGTFMAATNYPTGASPNALAVADLFGDQNYDLIAAIEGSYISYLQGDGAGAFYPPYAFTNGAQPVSVVAHDLNNDSWPDLASANGIANNVSVRLNDGLGDFGPVTNYSVSGYPYGIAVSDFNEDGNPDLATSNNQSNSVSVLLGSGTGTFQPAVSFPVDSIPYGIAVGDFNLDGNQDIVNASAGANTVTILLGNGNGLFQDAFAFVVGTEPVDVAVGDINDDGIPDLVTANRASDNLSVLLGVGNGYFSTPYNFAVGDLPDAIAIGDFNLDGKNDLVSTARTDGSVSVLLNTCVTLTSTPTIPIPTATRTSTPLPTQTPGGPTATPQTCAIQFADVPPDNTFYPFVRCLACRGIISGYACGGTGEPCNPANEPYFRPSNPVTRGQLAKIVSNSAGFSEPVSTQTFEDVLPGSAFYDFVGRLAARDVMGGYACGGTGEPCGPGNLPYFRPGSGATRAQLTKIVSNAASFSNPAPGTYTFTDVPVGSTFHVFVERLLTNRPGVMGGYNCGGVGEPCDTLNRPYFRPANPLSRGQTSKIVGNTFYPNCQTPSQADSK